jgi:hypothetical protein
MINLYPFDVSALNRIADTAYINTFDREYLQELANTIERYVSGQKYEEIPGADGEPDFAGVTYERRP